MDKKLLEELQLLNFERKNLGPQKSFIFKFDYRGKSYTFIHDLFYCGQIEHWFKLKKPLFSKKPFKFSKEDYLTLSNYFLSNAYKN